ncbi:MAG: hypothetical protein ACLFPQ_03985 [Candidatus Woesearchaeota archaeon]
MNRPERKAKREEKKAKFKKSIDDFADGSFMKIARQPARLVSRIFGKKDTEKSTARKYAESIVSFPVTTAFYSTLALAALSYAKGFVTGTINPTEYNTRTEYVDNLKIAQEGDSFWGTAHDIGALCIDGNRIELTADMMEDYHNEHIGERMLWPGDEMGAAVAVNYPRRLASGHNEGVESLKETARYSKERIDEIF